MSSEPSEDDIRQLLNMELFSTRSESINKLKVPKIILPRESCFSLTGLTHKANGNNLQRTVDAFFDGPGINPPEVNVWGH